MPDREKIKALMYKNKAHLGFNVYAQCVERAVKKAKRDAEQEYYEIKRQFSNKFSKGEDTWRIDPHQDNNIKRTITSTLSCTAHLDALRADRWLTFLFGVCSSIEKEAADKKDHDDPFPRESLFSSGDPYSDTNLYIQHFLISVFFRHLNREFARQINDIKQTKDKSYEYECYIGS